MNVSIDCERKIFLIPNCLKSNLQHMNQPKLGLKLYTQFYPTLKFQFSKESCRDWRLKSPKTSSHTSNQKYFFSFFCWEFFTNRMSNHTTNLNCNSFTTNTGTKQMRKQVEKIISGTRRFGISSRPWFPASKKLGPFLLAVFTKILININD